MIPVKCRCAAAAALFVVWATLDLVAEDAPPALIEQSVKPLGRIERIIGAPLLSPNGERLAWVVKKEDKLVVVCDGKEGREYMWSNALFTRRTMRFSQDGKRFVYLATKHPSGRYVWVCDRVEIAGHPRWPFTFSPDGRHTAYSANDDKTMRDGRPDGSGTTTGKTFVFSPDSRHLAYASGFRIICDGKKGPEFEKTVLGDPVWAPDSRSYAHTVSQGDKIGDKWVVFWGQRKFGPYDMVEGITFSPDSRRIAFRALSKNTWAVVVNDKKCQAFNNVGTIVFSADGKHLAYPACDDDGWRIVCDGKKGPACSEAGDPVFSPDSKHLAYRVIKDGEARVICDEEESASVGAVGWVGFSPDNEHLAFLATREGKTVIVCDGIESPGHEEIRVPERFADVPGKLRYVAIDKGDEAGKDACLVEVDWPTDRTWEDAFKAAAK